MRYVTTPVLVSADNLTVNGSQVDSNQLVSASFHFSFSDATAAGSVKLQISNDPCPYGNLAADFPVSHWVNLPNQSANIVAGSPALLTVPNMSFRWIRAVFTSTATGIQTITTIADDSAEANATAIDPIADLGEMQVQTVTTVDDIAGSLNSTYFLLSSVNLVSKVAKNFYVWLDDGSGIDPAIVGKTGIHVVYSDDDNADTIATLIRAALNALTNDFAASGATDQVVITNLAPGLVGLASDGIAATGFGFANTNPGIASNVNNTYLTLNSVNDVNKYYVWFNVSGIGTDPAVSGKTGIEIDINAGDSADDISNAMTTPIQNINGGNDFSVNNSPGEIIIHNVATGPCTAAADGPGGAATGFSIVTTVVGRNDGPHLLNSEYFFLNAPNAGTEYYVWYDVDGGGVDPSLAGKTGVPVAISAADSADTIAAATATEIDALSDFAATAVLNVITVTNSNSGPFVAASDFNTTFTFARTGGGSGILTVNMNALSA